MYGITYTVQINRTGFIMALFHKIQSSLVYSCAFLLLFTVQVSHAQVYLLRPDRVFDGTELHDGWVVLVEGERIRAAGPMDQINMPPSYQTFELSGMTILPGLIEGHSHILLHPYDEASWEDQVLREARALRVVRATVHAQNTLMAGFTTIRDLGSEGADYADVGIKQAIELGVISGPRMLVAGRSIVATGTFGPKGFDPHFDVPLGAEAADGADLVRVVRDQIGKGADVIKVYADASWGPGIRPRPTFSQDELELIVETAVSSGRPVVAHADSEEGMRRAILAGVETIEHGLIGGTRDIYRLMAERGVALYPTLAATEAIMQYRGWRKGIDTDPVLIRRQRTGFQAALEAGVSICSGSDAGVFPHGENARELELMVEYGMMPLDALQAATSLNARVLHLDDRLGIVKSDMLADLIAVEGNPIEDIKALREVSFVMKNGVVYKQP